MKNRNQIACIADIVINKVSGILGVAELAREENRNDRTAQFLDLALKDIRELINWVKFLQITHDLRVMSGSLVYEAKASEKRKEMRYPLPDIYRKYLIMKINVSGSLEPVVLSNFSRFGMQFRCRQPLDIDSVKEGILRSAGAIGKEVSFQVRIRYCAECEGEYIVGGKIEAISDSTTFDFFTNVHDFILDAIMKS